MTNPKCSFRIIGLSRELLTEMESDLLRGVPHRTRPYFKDKRSMVITLPIGESISAGFLAALIDRIGPNIKFDFFVSVSSPEQTLIVDIPSRVLELHHAVGGNVSFSYTCLSDNDCDEEADG